ncbi:unnamed protein product [Cylicocyclus nassatus]|uniref:Uncharacterized protein n=1 Tax=Cylicocyclus nassatus TaxID=53992 RepID=A0AA36HA63_CYLNA|nr:unnamed protein product [Cylicocyclus nassatus]
MRTIHILGLIALYGQHVQSQITPDCDLEFASSTLGIVQAHVVDPMKLANVEAILFSCNKSRMQKIAEISVFLLEKGTFPSRSMEDIRKVGLLVNEEKKRRLDLFWENMPPILKKTTDDITLILLNNSLSGNEKVQSFTDTVAALPREHRRALEEVFDQRAPQMHITPVAAKIDSHHEIAGFGKGDPEQPTTEILLSTPPPFPIEKEKEIIPGAEIGIPASTVIRKSGPEPLFPPSPPNHRSSPQLLQPIRPANQKRSDPLKELLGAAMNIDADQRGTSTSQGGSFNALFKPLPGFTDKKPKSLGIVQKQTETIEMDDSDLLNPRSSLLSDAVRLLEKTIPLINPMRPPMLSKDSRFSPSQTFSIPGKSLSHPSDSIPVPLSEQRTLLPSRDDPLHPDVAPISPVNRARSLGTFDTHLGRFASGVPNRVILHTNQLASIKDMDRLNAPSSRHLPPPPNYLTTRTEQFTTYPDHREGLFPEVNQVRPLSQQARVFRPSSQESAVYPTNHTKGTITNNVPTSNRDKTFHIENYPPAPYGIAPRPKQTIGHDLLDTDRLGSWSMGRFDKEEPYYPTPEPRRESTTVIAVLQERTTKASSDLSTFNEKPAVLPMFQRYQSPESITGSHALREVYNIRHHGRPRFVKIDLSNE